MHRLIKLMAATTLIFSAQNSAADANVESTRWVGKYLYLMVKTSDKHFVKCILYDGAGKPLMVKNSHITPPYDEVQIHVTLPKSNVKTAECL